MERRTAADVKIASIRALIGAQEKRLDRIEAKLDASLARKDGLSLPQAGGISAVVTAIVEIVQRLM